MKRLFKITAVFITALSVVLSSSAFAKKLPDGGDDTSSSFKMLDASDYGSIISAGFVPDSRYTLSSKFSACWSDIKNNNYLKFVNFPKDLTEYDEMTFSVYSPKKTNSQFAMVVRSPNSAAGACYYLNVNKIDWEGWKEFKLKLNSAEDFTISRTPSWDNITQIYVQSNGFTLPNPEDGISIYFDTISFKKKSGGRAFSAKEENSLEKASKDAVVLYKDYRKIISDGKTETLEDGYFHKYINNKVYVNDSFIKKYLGSKKLDEIRKLNSEDYDDVLYYSLEDVAKIKKLNFLRNGMLEAVSLKSDTNNISDFKDDEIAYIAKYKISYSAVDKEKAYSDISSVKSSVKQRLINSVNDKGEIAAEALKLSSDLNKELAKGSITRYSLWDSTVSADECLDKTYQKILTMALAYNMQGTDTYKSPEILDSVTKALDWMEANKYGKASTTAKYSGNWWNWCIGAPLDLTDILILMQDDLDDEKVKSYLVPVNYYMQIANSLAEDELNKQWLCYSKIKAALLESDTDALSDVRDNIFSGIKYTHVGDGFYSDGSYIAHSGTVYSLGYGSSTVFAAARNASVLGGSSFEIDDPNIYTVESLLTDSYAKIFYNGRAMVAFDGDGMNGFDEYGYTASYISALVDIYDACGSDEAAVKACELYNKTKEKITLSDYYVNKINSISDKGSDETAASFTAFNDADRAVYHGKDFALCIAMSSDKITRFESIDSANAKGWYTGDGAVYLYTDGEENVFSNSFYNDSDMTQIPGTTEPFGNRIEKAFPKYGALLTNSSYVGSVDLGDVGVSAIDFKSYSDSDTSERNVFSSDLKAKKSYFMLGDAIICIGSDINSTDGKDIRTCVDNSKADVTAKGDNYLVFKDRAGYCFFDGQYTLFENGEYNIASIDHGVNPHRAKYAYAIIPNADKNDCKEFISSNAIKIAANNESVQAVESNGVTAAVFYSSSSFGSVSSDTPLMLIYNKDEMKVYDPTGKYKNAVIKINDTVYEAEFDTKGMYSTVLK